MGLMLGIEFHDISNALLPPFDKLISTLDKQLKGSITGFLGSILLNKYNILIGFTEYNRNVMRLHPPLITQKDHIDYFIRSIDRTISKGVIGIVKDFIKIKL